MVISFPRNERIYNNPNNELQRTFYDLFSTWIKISILLAYSFLVKNTDLPRKLSYHQEEFLNGNLLFDFTERLI